MTVSAETTQWAIFREAWLEEDPMPHHRAEVRRHRAHRKPRPRMQVGALAGVVAALVAAVALTVYGVAGLWQTGVPLPRMLPILAAMMLSGILITMGVISLQQAYQSRGVRIGIRERSQDSTASTVDGER